MGIALILKIRYTNFPCGRTHAPYHNVVGSENSFMQLLHKFAGGGVCPESTRHTSAPKAPSTYAAESRSEVSQGLGWVGKNNQVIAVQA